MSSFIHKCFEFILQLTSMFFISNLQLKIVIKLEVITQITGEEDFFLCFFFSFFLGFSQGHAIAFIAELTLTLNLNIICHLPWNFSNQDFLLNSMLASCKCHWVNCLKSKKKHRLFLSWFWCRISIFSHR